MSIDPEQGIRATYDEVDGDILRIQWGQGIPDRTIGLPRVSPTELAIHGASITDIERLAHDLLKIIQVWRMV